VRESFLEYSGIWIAKLRMILQQNEMHESTLLDSAFPIEKDTDKGYIIRESQCNASSSHITIHKCHATKDTGEHPKDIQIHSS